jgi:hypothetical protein
VETEIRLQKQDKLLYIPTDHGKEIGTMMEILRAEGGKDRVVVDLSQITLSVCLCLTLCMLEALFLALSLFHFLFSPPLSLSLSLSLSLPIYHR